MIKKKIIKKNKAQKKINVKKFASNLQNLKIIFLLMMINSKIHQIKTIKKNQKKSKIFSNNQALKAYQKINLKRRSTWLRQNFVVIMWFQEKNIWKNQFLKINSLNLSWREINQKINLIIFSIIFMIQESLSRYFISASRINLKFMQKRMYKIQGHIQI